MFDICGFYFWSKGENKLFSTNASIELPGDTIPGKSTRTSLSAAEKEFPADSSFRIRTCQGLEKVATQHT